MTRNVEPAARRQRRGWTLIELLIVCSVTGVLSVLGVVTVGTMLSAENRGGESLVLQTTIARFASQFRNDVHAASESIVHDEDEAGHGRLLLPQDDGRTVEYLIVDDAIERRVDMDEQPDHFESFRIPEARAEFGSEGRLVRAVLHVPRPTLNEMATDGTAAPTDRIVTIEATTAWDRRHVTSVATDEGYAD